MRAATAFALAGAGSAAAARSTAAARFLAPLLLAPLLLASPLLAQEADEDHPGKPAYDKWCSSCHGIEGDGQGPAAGYMLPRPRDFTTGLYQIRTTHGGELPTDDDLLHIINEGMPGTTMPGWEDALSRNERRALVDYLKTFSRFFTSDAQPDPIDFGSAPRATDDRLAEGRLFYDSIECWQCHGQAGRGDGPSAPTLEDDADFPIRAVDLTRNWAFNGGGSAEDIYRRLRTGLDGTPMPTFSDLIDAEFITEDQLWNLALYVRSLAPERRPRTREVVRAGLMQDEELPTSPVDDRWDEVESFHIPLVGQIVVPPRWFDPRVESMTVRALHDGSELAVLVSWSDPSRSPDPRWLEWQERVLEVMEPKEGGRTEAESLPDRIAIQFPLEMPSGMERPYFLMGSERSSVYLWQWTSQEEGGTEPVATEAVARGMDEIEALGPGGGAGDLESVAEYADGQWRVLFRRPLDTGTDDRLQFTTAEAIPMGFFAWDGDHGESGTQGAISTWYYIYLEEATPIRVFVTPFIALALTALLGLFVVARAQKREHAAKEESTAA